MNAHKRWAQENVIDATTAAARCGVIPRYIRRACEDGRIANAWKASNDSRVWLMFWDDVITWRENVRQYTRGD